MLQEEIQRATGAYDSIAKKVAGKIHLGFTNGTEDAYVTIDDYKEVRMSSKGREYIAKTRVLKTTPRVFILDHSPNINTTKGQINTTGVLFNTLVFAV